MSKKLRFLVVGVLFICLIPLAAGAVVINYNKNIVGNEFVSPYFATTVDFNADVIGGLPGGPWTWSGNAVVLNGDVPNKASAPFGDYERDKSNYVSIPKNDDLSTSANTATISLGGTYDYFGLWWGSIDNYNTLNFFKSGVQVASFDGTAANSPNPANGNQVAPAQNTYVNFLYLPAFDSFSMSSWQHPSLGISYALEADNLTVGVVPEPATMMLLGLGLVGLAGVRRVFKK